MVADVRAAVYRGTNEVRIEELPVPSIEPGEILLKVQACGLCGTDLKKIAHGDLAPPLVFGHEVAGRVAQVGAGVTRWKEGDRVLFFHHIPCRACDYCRSGHYAQCPQYKRVGATAGFEPAGGGFAEYVKVMDWIAKEGLVRIPDGVEDEEATFVEPVNTCLKGIRKAGVTAEKSVLILGSGPVGLILLQLARRAGARVTVTDLIPERLRIAKDLGATDTFLAGEKNAGDRPPVEIALVAAASPQAVQAALDAVRPAGRVVLFAQTRLGESASLDVGQIGKLEKELIGSYSASVDLQEESARMVFSREIQVKPLITHRFGLDRIQEAIRVAMNPSATSLKVIVKPTKQGQIP
ncbi:MAG: alcohol dehydrogenase catalytic domain-containing protein [Candidatus Omnitrophica bacterium]|nr:alcohol dehydrogenase catalytic domain-containing protein [Candidatus Omnitrophota bacterium]